ncbi:Cys/Met metabolism PLP-dependent enzyme [Ostertagia ostertagi]
MEETKRQKQREGMSVIDGGMVSIAKEAHRAHLTPIYASSTYTFNTAQQGIDIFQGNEEGYIYGRFGNPTIREAEAKIALLEGAGLRNSDGQPLQLYAILHASGMAAITTMLLGNLKSGDKIITHHSLYGGTQELVDKILPGLGIESVIVDFHQPELVAAAITADAQIKMMYIETPANPTLQCVDMEVLSALGRQHHLIVCADNTFATPYLQQPFRYEPCQYPYRFPLMYDHYFSIEELRHHLITQRTMEQLKLDVAVIGGGCSGAYSAWRLQQAYGKEQSIALFEYSDRIGGRLYTVTMPGLPNVKAEVGGMRYIPTEHKLVADLITHLGLETKDFPMGAPEPRPTWLDKDYALMPVAKGGCGTLEGCITATAMDATLASMTPNCLTKVQEG